MPRRRKPPINRKAAALEAHAKFLRKHGIDPDCKPKLRGAVASPLEAVHEYRAPTVPTSDRIPGVGPSMKQPPRLQSNLGIAQVYHKGPLMVVSNFNDLQGSRRRD